MRPARTSSVRPAATAWILTGAVAAAIGSPAALPAVAADVKASTPAAAPSTAPATGPSTAPAIAPASPLAAVRTAPNPSAAVDAYARAATTQPGNLDLEKAYIHRMVELNVPEMADLQARNLVQRDGSDGVAWAVVAYMAAARGAPAAAVQNLKTALEQSPDDPFVLRTAAQVVAWYDATTDRSMLSKDDTQTLEWIRAHSAGKPVYADAYRAAQEMRRSWATSAATQPSVESAPATQPAPEAAAAAPYAPVPETAPYTYSYPTYTDPYAYSPVYPAYPYYYGGGYYYYWPGVIILRDHRFHHDRFRHDGFDHFDHDHLDHGHLGGGVGGYWHDGYRHDGLGMGDRDGRPVVGPQPPPPRMTTPGGSFNRTDHTFAQPPHTFGQPPAAQPRPMPPRGSAPPPRSSDGRRSSGSFGGGGGRDGGGGGGHFGARR